MTRVEVNAAGSKQALILPFVLPPAQSMQTSSSKGYYYCLVSSTIRSLGVEWTWRILVGTYLSPDVPSHQTYEEKGSPKKPGCIRSTITSIV